MEIRDMIILTLHITTVLTKKHYSTEEEGESIENLLYYKDCNHRAKEPVTVTPSPRPEPLKLREPECPCPRMCCSMCCDCGAPQNMGRQQPFQQSSSFSFPFLNQGQSRSMQQPPSQFQPPIISRKTARMRPIPDGQNLIPPTGGRRIGFTRENVKTLISHDEDIKKILKDLVRVTMQKVDLEEMVRKTARKDAEPSNISDDDN